LFVAGTTASAAAAAASSANYGSADSSLVDDEDAERVQQAVEVVAEMQLTAEQLKVRRELYASRCAKDSSLNTATNCMQPGRDSTGIQSLLCWEHEAASQGWLCVQTAFSPYHASTAEHGLQQLAGCSSASLSVFGRLACAPCRLL
jgi:hypothetical protein